MGEGRGVGRKTRVERRDGVRVVGLGKISGEGIHGLEGAKTRIGMGGMVRYCE